jgi:ABC-type phosphate transport system substrate-binding protein
VRRNSNVGKIFLWLTVALLASFSMQAQEPGVKGEIAVVVNTKSPVKDITLAKLRKLATGEQRRWDQGENVYLLVPSQGTPGHDTVLKRVYEMNDAQYQQFWIQKVFRGEVSAEPTRYFANGTVYAGADALPGALAFIDAQAVRPGLKVLRVNGKLPGEPGYPLAP